MRLNILFGGKAGQGANEITETIGEILVEKGYYIFNYRDYSSLIRGGHNYNILCISNSPIMSHDWKVDILLALDERTLKEHKNNLKKQTKIIHFKEDFGLATNMFYASALLCYLGIDKQILINKIKNKYDKKYWKQDIEAVEKGYCIKDRIKLEQATNKPKKIISGGKAVSISAKNSKLDFYFAYPMTPATSVLHELANFPEVKVFQSGNEIEAVNSALGASYAGKLSMTGTSGGGFDLMSETLSMQGISEIPLTVYLASRPGPGTGVPTYSMQQDINISLYAGHGEFPRVVLCPGDPKEAYLLTNQALILAEKFNCLSVILSDKHLAESEFTINDFEKISPVKITRKIPGKEIVKASSYEHLENGDTIEDSENTIKAMEKRLEKEKQIKEQIKKLETYKIHGDKNSDTLFISTGSTKGAILDYIYEEGGKFLQLLYISPFPDIKKEIEKAKKVYIVETNSTGQLKNLIKQKICPEKELISILKYDARPFTPEDIKEKIK